MAEAKTGAVRTIYAVSELNEILRALVEDSLPSLWIQAEISNFSKPSSGHWYFTLKDEQAQIRCAMFRKANYYIRPLPQNGDAVLVRAKASVYPARGELQLIVEHLEPAGTGALLRAFEELKARLAAEGLFDTALKRPIPPVPRRIGLITSGTGAAVHDVLTTLARRWPLAEVLFYPVPVQGAEAPAAIVKALQALSQLGTLDTVLLVRGGGSIEDLWAFNNEAVARAIRGCRVPVVTGVGHEVDITIADFASDLRGATPTAAAELITPDIAERLQHIRLKSDALIRGLERGLRAGAEHVDRHISKLRTLHPGRRLEQRAQRLDESSVRLSRTMRTHLTSQARCVQGLNEKIMRCDPGKALIVHQATLRHHLARLNALWRARHSEHSTMVVQQEALLNSLNPRAVLKRGFAIVHNDAGHIVRDAASVQAGEALRIEVALGSIEAEVVQRRE